MFSVLRCAINGGISSNDVYAVEEREMMITESCSETFPEDGPCGSLQGKNFGNARLDGASLLSFMRTNKKYYLRISEVFRSDHARQTVHLISSIRRIVNTVLTDQAQPIIGGASMITRTQKLKGGFVRVIEEDDEGNFIRDQILDFEKYRASKFFHKESKG